MASMRRDRAYRSTTNAERNKKKTISRNDFSVFFFNAKGVNNNNNNNTSAAEGRSYCNNMQIRRSNI